jgi:hypothetical protein
LQLSGIPTSILTEVGKISYLAERENNSTLSIQILQHPGHWHNKIPKNNAKDTQEFKT